MQSRRWPLLLALLAGVGMAVHLLLATGTQDGTPRHVVGAADIPPRTADPVRSMPGAESETALSRADAAGPASAPPTSPDSAARASQPDLQSRETRVQTLIEALSTLQAERDGASAAGDNAKDAWEQAWQAAHLRAQMAANAHPASATQILQAADAAQSEALALRLGRALRTAEHPAFVQELRQRVQNATLPPRQRLIALVALEFRPYEVWGEVTRHAFEADADGGVREEAARVLGHALAQPTYIEQRDELRQTLVQGLVSPEPEHRRRSALSLLAERNPSPALIEQVRTLSTDDPDPSVRQTAASTLRVLEGRLR